MFKHGFLNNRSVPQRWDLEHAETVQRSRPPLSVEDPESLKSRSGFDLDDPVARTKEFHQQNTYSHDSGWTLNTELDRVSSSLASWDEDEFERETSRRVETLLQELDAALYEGAPLSNKHLQQECAEWAAKFPYLRVVGNQIAPPRREKGYSYHASSSQLARKSRGPSAASKDLLVVGRKLKPNAIPFCEDDEGADAAVAEELLIQDGIYEEYLAVDRSAEDARERTLRDQFTTESVLAAPSDGRLKKEIVEALFDTVWPDVEKSLREVRAPAGDAASVQFSDNQLLPAPDQELPPTSLRLRSHVSPATKKRVPSTAIATYGSHGSEGPRKVASSVSRTAPAVFRGRPPSANFREATAGPMFRNSRFTKLPPIEASAPYLPNMPASKPQSSRTTDQVAKVTEDSIDDDDDDGLIDSVKKASAIPPIMDPKLAKQTDAVVDSSAIISRNMQALRIGKRQPVDLKSHNKVARNTSIGSDGRRARTIGMGGQHGSLVIQGYQQRAFSK